MVSSDLILCMLCVYMCMYEFTCACSRMNECICMWKYICLGMCMHLKVRGWHCLLSSIAFPPSILNPCLTHAQSSLASWIAPRAPVSTSMILRWLAIHQVYLTFMWMLRLQTLVSTLEKQLFTIWSILHWKFLLESLNWHWYGQEGWIGTKYTSSLWPKSDSSIQFHFCNFG